MDKIMIMEENSDGLDFADAKFVPVLRLYKGS